MKLSHRQQHILWATIRHYIATAEPVGSKSLADEYGLDVSPATVRNAMSYLERAGLLFQPHTSAGRVPSDSGYRIYVDRLMQPTDILARQVDSLLDGRLNWIDWSLEAVLRGAAQLLATLSGYVTLITMPQLKMSQVRHIQLVQVNPGQVLLIVVLDSYESYSNLVQLPQVNGEELESDELIDRELQLLSNFLNHQLRGRSLSDVANLDWQELDQEFQRYADLIKVAVQALNRRTQTPNTTQIFISGLSEVLRQPEFSETQQLQAILHLLEEEPDQLWPLIFDGVDADQSTQRTTRRVTVRIGAENPLEPMQACAIVSSPYYRGTLPVGSVGVLGPTRMIYDSAIPVVEATAEYLSQALSTHQ